MIVPGAKLGAIRGGMPWTAVDRGGARGTRCLVEWTLVDAHGCGLETYGSGGWVFESPRARWRNPL